MKQAIDNFFKNNGFGSFILYIYLGVIGLYFIIALVKSIFKKRPQKLDKYEKTFEKYLSIDENKKHRLKYDLAPFIAVFSSMILFVLAYDHKTDESLQNTYFTIAFILSTAAVIYYTVRYLFNGGYKNMKNFTASYSKLETPEYVDVTEYTVDEVGNKIGPEKHYRQDKKDVGFSNLITILINVFTFIINVVITLSFATGYMIVSFFYLIFEGIFSSWTKQLYYSLAQNRYTRHIGYRAYYNGFHLSNPYKEEWDEYNEIPRKLHKLWIESSYKNIVAKRDRFFLCCQRDAAIVGIYVHKLIDVFEGEFGKIYIYESKIGRIHVGIKDGNIDINNNEDYNFVYIPYDYEYFNEIYEGTDLSDGSVVENMNFLQYFYIKKLKEEGKHKKVYAVICEERKLKIVKANLSDIELDEENRAIKVKNYKISKKSLRPFYPSIIASKLMNLIAAALFAVIAYILKNPVLYAVPLFLIIYWIMHLVKINQYKKETSL